MFSVNDSEVEDELATDANSNVLEPCSRLKLKDAAELSAVLDFVADNLEEVVAEALVDSEVVFARRMAKIPDATPWPTLFPSTTDPVDCLEVAIEVVLAELKVLRLL